MKNRRFFTVVAVIVALSLALGGCALSSELVGNMIAPWERAQQTPEPEQTTAPSASLQPLPTPEMTSAPTASTQVSPVSGDIDSLMLLSPDEVSYIKGLWPLKSYAPEDFGAFSSVFASYGNGYLYLSYTLDSGKTLEELKTGLKACVSGPWTDDTSGASVYKGTAEGISTDCSVYDDGTSRTVDFTFSINGSFDEINAILDAHWAGGMIDMPPEMQGNIDSRCVMLDPIMIYISYEWKPSEYKDTFQWFRDNLSGMEGYTYSPATDIDDETIAFKIGDADVKISVIEAYGAIDVTFMSYPDNFTL